MTDSEHQTSSHRTGRKRSDLDRETWEALMAALAPDRELAGQKYEDLRHRLCNLFAWERSDAPEDLADEAINRLARKVMEGAVIPHLDRFAFGIARLMLQEESRKQRNRETMVRELQTTSSVDSRHWSAVESMESCLGRLPADRRELIERYYAEDRAALARKLGLSLNALRNRAMRIRQELSRCMSLSDGS
jgi:DNA-directed RNA polymerase specialized sigma24 family protein